MSTSGGRAALALLHPSKALLAKFPRMTLKPSKKLFRAHQSVYGAWWFSPNGGTPEGGRFDLASGHGTCYLADSPAAAVREYLGRAGVASVINVAELADRVVSTLSVGKPRSLADTTSARAANHGITKEISTTVDYALTQQWAQAWSRDGLDGVRYAGRFDVPRQSLLRLIRPGGGRSGGSRGLSSRRSHGCREEGRDQGRRRPDGRDDHCAG